MTYASLAVPFVGLAAAVLVVAAVVRRPGRRWWAATGLTLLALLVLTAVFDNVIVGTGIVGYDPDRILGVRIGVAPVEDFAYPIAAALGLPALWVLLGPRREPPC